DLLAEDGHVGLIPVRRDEDADRVGHDLAQQLGHRILALGVFLLEVVKELDTEPDVALLVLRDVAHALVEAGKDAALGQVALDEGREVVGHRVLAVEEQRVVPDRCVALVLCEDLMPVVLVLGEVELGGAPVALLPALVEIAVGDLVDCGDGGGFHSGEAYRRRRVNKTCRYIRAKRPTTCPSGSAKWAIVGPSGTSIGPKSRLPPRLSAF